MSFEAGQTFADRPIAYDEDKQISLTLSKGFQYERCIPVFGIAGLLFWTVIWLTSSYWRRGHQI